MLESESGRRSALRRAIDENTLWYHTMELQHGIVTPGWFDLRPVVDMLPWPDVSGKRCLDVGTYDGFFAFEMERRGAAEVVATDIPSHEEWDWPPLVRARGPLALKEIAGEKGRGFEIASSALASRVQKHEISVYELSRRRLGRFDVVVCGSLLLHLRDPFRALDAIRGVCSGFFLSSEQIDIALTLLHPRTPLTRIHGGSSVQWHVPNLAGHRRMIRTAGFEIVHANRPFSIPFGPSHPRDVRSYRPWQRLLRRLATGGFGVPHSSVLARAVAT